MRPRRSVNCVETLEEVLEAQMVRRSKEGRTARRVAGVGRKSGAGAETAPAVTAASVGHVGRGHYRRRFFCRLRAADHKGAPWCATPSI